MPPPLKVNAHTVIERVQEIKELVQQVQGMDQQVENYEERVDRGAAFKGGPRLKCHSSGVKLR